MRAPLLIVVLGWAIGSIAQSIPLSGVVVVHNSAYTTGRAIAVRDVAVRAPFAKAVTSDNTGAFALAFAGVASGTSLRITVEKPAMEVVNVRELEQVVIGGSSPLRVVLAHTKDLADAQAAFHGLATDAIERSFKGRMQALRDTSIALDRRLMVVRNELNDTINTFGDALTALTRQRNASLSRAEELAREFARADLDEASALYREAYGAFGRGQLDSALYVLDKDRLDADYARTMADKEQGTGIVETANKAIRQLYASHGLKADVLKTTMAYRQALAVYRTMGSILQEQADAFDPTTEVELHEQMAILFLDLGDVREARAGMETALRIAHARLDPSDPKLAVIISELALMHLEAGGTAMGLAYADTAIDRLRTMDGQDLRLSNALYYRSALYQQAGDHAASTVDLDSSIAIKTRLLGADAKALCNMYRQRSDLMRAQDRREESVHWGRRSLDIALRTYPNGHMEVGRSYKALGSAYQEMRQLDSALFCYRKDAEIQEQLFGDVHPALGGAYLGMGALKWLMHQPDSALHLFLRAQRILEATRDPEHPQLAMLHQHMAVAYADLGDDQHAQEELHRALDIYIRKYGPDHPLTADVYGALGSLAERRRDYAATVDNYRKSLDVRVKAGLINGPRMAGALNNIGAAFLKLGVNEQTVGAYDSAYAYLSRAMELAEKVSRPEEEIIGLVHLQLGRTLFYMTRCAEARSHFRAARAVYNMLDSDPYALDLQSEVYIGRCYFEEGVMDSAQVISERTVNAAARGDEVWVQLAQGMAAWTMYLLHTRRNDDAAALEWAIVCGRKRQNNAGVSPKDRTMTMNALRTLATKLGRTDVLKEFGLE